MLMPAHWRRRNGVRPAVIEMFFTLVSAPELAQELFLMAVFITGRQGPREKADTRGLTATVPYATAGNEGASRRSPRAPQLPGELDRNSDRIRILSCWEWRAATFKR